MGAQIKAYEGHASSTDSASSISIASFSSIRSLQRPSSCISDKDLQEKRRKTGDRFISNCAGGTGANPTETGASYALRLMEADRPINDTHAGIPATASGSAPEASASQFLTVSITVPNQTEHSWNEFLVNTIIESGEGISREDATLWLEVTLQAALQVGKVSGYEDCESKLIAYINNGGKITPVGAASLSSYRGAEGDYQLAAGMVGQ